MFLHESFEQLESIKPPGTQKTYVTCPKTPQQMEILLRDNRQTIEHIAKQGGNIIFPRRNPPKSANCDTKSKIEPKKKSKIYRPSWGSNSSFTSECEHSNPQRPVLVRNKVKKGSLIAQKGPLGDTTTTKPNKGHSKVGKNFPCKKPKSDNVENFVNFENFVQKVMKNLNNTHINQ